MGGSWAFTKNQKVNIKDSGIDSLSDTLIRLAREKQLKYSL